VIEGHLVIYRDMVSRFAKKEIYFEKNTPFHIINRAVEGREIFAKKDDALRFIFQMHAANIGSPGFNLSRHDINKVAWAILLGEKVSQKFINVKHPPLVNLLSFVLTFNHHHFVLVSNTEGGISKYLQKLHNGFAKYFNLKYNRRDTLFERKYGAVPIKSNFQSDAVIYYVNIKNVLDVFQPGWKKQGLENKDEVIKFLNEYPFSSFPDLFGKRNSKILAPLSFREKYLGKKEVENQSIFFDFLKNYLQQKLVAYHPLFLEEQ